MNIKKWFLMVSLANAALLAAAAYFTREVPWRHSAHRAGVVNADLGPHSVSELTSLQDSSLGFMPQVEAVLPGKDRCPELLDLETGHRLALPDYDSFEAPSEAIMAWIRTNGLDISGRIWPGGAACVTYNMTVVPIETRCWAELTAQDLLNNKVLANPQQAPRRLLVLGPGRPDTYLFRTQEGNLGILRLLGLSDDSRGVEICYKLLE
jgi:hypothetical protein